MQNKRSRHDAENDSDKCAPSSQNSMLSTKQPIGKDPEHTSPRNIHNNNQPVIAVSRIEFLIIMVSCFALGIIIGVTVFHLLLVLVGGKN